MENKNKTTKMVNRYKVECRRQKRIEELAMEFVDVKCKHRKSNKLVDAYKGIAYMIEDRWRDTEGKDVELVNISSKHLRKTYGRHYAEIIHDLWQNGMITVNETYCQGAFSKSYGIVNPDAKTDESGRDGYTSVKASREEIRKYEDMIERCPDAIEFDGIRYKLDKERMMHDVESGNLGVNQAVKGMRCYIDRKRNHEHHYTGARDFNWFTIMPKDFRHYILGENNGKMVEALDLTAGNILCVILSAYDKGIISKRERDKAVEYIKNDIYIEIRSFAAKTNPRYGKVSRKDIKHYTQIFLNSTSKRFYKETAQVSKFFRRYLPKLYRHIRNYPTNSEGKKTMYWDFIEVEKKLIERIQSILLSNYGIHSIRVHDAVYVDSSLLPDRFNSKDLVFSIL
ncbi:MAG: hypothetical protein IK084_02750 [Bacteroidaceae bacterium]|nr:hypothetical protein [Bacteroidaceae bacterium]